MNEMPDEVDHADQRKKIEEAFLKSRFMLSHPSLLYLCYIDICGTLRSECDHAVVSHRNEHRYPDVYTSSAVLWLVKSLNFHPVRHCLIAQARSWA